MDTSKQDRHEPRIQRHFRAAHIEGVSDIEPKPLAPMGPPLLSLDELVAWCGIPKSTMYSLMQDSRGPRSMKLGRQLRFRPADVDAWLDGLAIEREAAA